LFWYLTLFDREWFEESFPSGGRGTTEHIPSIELDRLSILQAIRKAPRNSVRVWKNLSQQAFFRASLRDIEWLEARKSETAHEIRKNRLASRHKYIEACTNDIKQAIERVQAIKGSWVDISPSVLAPYSELSEDQLRHFLTKHPDIKKHLVDAAHQMTNREKIVD
jgi:uncharacterized protein YnzC (UPF0291/DUF896 family)